MNAFATVCIIDVDARIPLAERKAYAAAQQEQILLDVAPVWGRLAGVRAATPDQPPKTGEIQIRLLDKPTADGALGYHDQLDDGTPIAYVFCGLARELGDEWTTVASHEVLELLIDPLLRRCAQTPRGFEIVEICDASEQDSYSRQGVLLSNFLYPEAFEPPKNTTGVKFDHLGLLQSWDEVRPGGYAQYYDPKKGWQQIGQMSAYRTAMAELGLSRGVRRRKRTKRPSWLKRVIARLFG